MSEEKILLTGVELNLALDHLLGRIAAAEKGHESSLAIVGIRTRGVPLAERLARGIEKCSGVLPNTGAVDITLYRDDLQSAKAAPLVRPTELNFDVQGKRIILVDDVLFTGRTVRSAMSVILDFGRPAFIRLAALIDRGGRELPIEPQFTGKKLDLPANKSVKVLLKEIDGEDKVVVLG